MYNTNLLEVMIIKFKSLWIFDNLLFVQISGVSGWIRRNPNIVQVLRSVGKNGCSLTVMSKHDFDLQSQPRLGQGKVPCQKSRPKVKQFKRETFDRQTHKWTDGWTDATKYIISLASWSIKKDSSLMRLNLRPG